ncbi:ESPR-type extended signal peptide-containing protein [Phascolarctobacterium succinatutens]|uniref:ESPR-type extended signal peptide-containing protein n=2 Tax=Phascolarctobacterium succinatutens TaxID=626940 RepID=UPI00307EE0CA
MNKVFKVIWSEARNAYVVVSEMAKSHGTKSCSTKKLLAMLIATGVMTCASVAPVMAANLAPTDTKIEAGDGASASGQGSVAIGQNAAASGLVGIAIGRDAIASGTDSIAIGSSTKADQTFSVAVGNDIKFTAYAGTAVGQQAYASGDNATAIGTMTNVDADYNRTHDDWRKAGAQSTAIGAYAGSWGLASTAVGGFSKAEGKLATAVGYNSKANVDYGTALGDYSEVTAGWGVAIGASSVADRESGVVGAFAPEGADSLTWRANGGAVSVGSATLTRQITNVAAGSEATDAVNVAQLKAATENAGWNLSTGKEITNPTKVKSGAIVDFSGDDENITVSKEETDFATLVNVKLNRNLNVDSVQAGDYFMNSNMGIGFGGDAYITQNGLDANNNVISNVAAGVYNTDAVNVGQLKEVEEVAANANKGWNLSTNGVATEATNVAPGEYVDFSGDKNISVSHDGTKVKAELNKDLVDIESISNGDAKLTLGGLATELTNGQGASVKLFGDATIINGKVNVYNDGRIAGVAAGINDTDAVNVSQLKNSAWKLAANGVLTEAEDVKAGDYVDFNGDQNVSVSKDVKDGVKTVKVELNKDLKNIETISNGDAKLTLGGFTTELTNGQGASVKLFGDTTTINNAVTVYKDGRIAGVAAGINDNDAVNVGQLKAVGATANMGWNLATNGVATEATNVKPGDFVDFSGDKNISVSHDGTKVQVKLNENIDVNSVQTNALNSKYNLSVGTANENGIMPFFVNSNGAFYGANNNFSVDKDGKVTATAGEIGNVVLNNGVFTGHSALRDGELFVGDASGNYSQITTKGAKLGKVTVAADGKISGVAAGAITADSTDAVNGSQLHAVATEAGKHSKVVNGSNINVEETDVDGQKFYKVNLNKDIILGDLTGKYVNISGTNGTIETTGYIATQDRVYADKGAKLADIDVTGNKISNGASSIVLDGSNVKVNDKVTIDQNGKISGVAAGEVSSTSTDAINGSQLKETNDRVTKNEQDIAQNKADIAALDNRVTQNEADIAANRADIDKNKADIAANRTDIDKNAADIAQNKTDIKNLDNRVTNVEELAKKHTTVTAGDNITVTEDTNKDGGKEYKVALKEEIKLGSETTGQTVMNKDGLKVGDKVSVTKDAVTAGKTSISDEGVKVGDKTYISDKGLNANDQKVTNVAAGEISATSKDAVNGSQLYATNQEVANNTNRINKLGSRVNKVGAGAAALAALHPMDFDPDDKLTFSAGYGNYAGENAAAIGAYYRPDEKVMFSVAGTVGNGENMVNAGVSFALDRTNHVSNSRTALAREVIDLRGQLAVMGAKMAKMEKAFGMLDETKTKLFPDVPANHWAYEYIAKLAGNGYIEGYPDGNFGGDRLMTRYEFAAMLYRAIENGAALEEKIIKEFEPELGRIRVDRISGEDGDRDKIERVRVNDTKGERDHYGNKLAK